MIQVDTCASYSGGLGSCLNSEVRCPQKFFIFNASASKVCKRGHHHFLHNPFQFIMHYYINMVLLSLLNDLV
jgi:hypothetical protein